METDRHPHGYAIRHRGMLKKLLHRRQVIAHRPPIQRRFWRRSMILVTLVAAGLQQGGHALMQARC
jgi:hypothetical protein